MAPVARETPSRSSLSSAVSSRSLSSSHMHGASSESCLSSPPTIANKRRQKKPPVIRMVRVFAPKLVKTDTANFRALVQKLTGKEQRPNPETEEIDGHVRSDSVSVHLPNSEQPNGVELDLLMNDNCGRIEEDSKDAFADENNDWVSFNDGTELANCLESGRAVDDDVIQLNFNGFYHPYVPRQFNMQYDSYQLLLNPSG